jgi:4-carboxymuconolactone decarboxylase
MRASAPGLAWGTVDTAEDLLRRLALNDERVLTMVLTRRVGSDQPTDLDPKIELLVGLAALLAVGATTPSLREAVEQATAAGATNDEIVGVLVGLGPTIGLAGLVASARKLAMAIGYDLENGHSRAGGPGRGDSGGAAMRR